MVAKDNWAMQLSMRALRRKYWKYLKRTWKWKNRLADYPTGSAIYTRAEVVNIFNDYLSAWRLCQEELNRRGQYV